MTEEAQARFEVQQTGFDHHLSKRLFLLMVLVGGPLSFLIIFALIKVLDDNVPTGFYVLGVIILMLWPLPFIVRASRSSRHVHFLEDKIIVLQQPRGAHSKVKPRQRELFYANKKYISLYHMFEVLSEDHRILVIDFEDKKSLVIDANQSDLTASGNLVSLDKLLDFLCKKFGVQLLQDKKGRYQSQYIRRYVMVDNILK